MKVVFVCGGETVGILFLDDKTEVKPGDEFIISSSGKNCNFSNSYIVESYDKGSNNIATVRRGNVIPLRHIELEILQKVGNHNYYLTSFLYPQKNLSKLRELKTKIFFLRLKRGRRIIKKSAYNVLSFDGDTFVCEIFLNQIFLWFKKVFFWRKRK
jgi:hypothetical protein